MTEVSATTEKMSEIAEELRGTCASLDTALKNHGLDFDSTPRRFLDMLDEEVMDCQQCGWWHESHELNDDQICNDCKEDE